MVTKEHRSSTLVRLTMRARQLLTRLHLVVGCIAAPFLIVLGVTGAALVFESQIADLLDPGLMRVAPRGHPLTIAQLTALVAPSVPGGTLAGVALPDDDSHSAVLLFASPSVERGGVALLVDPYDGRVLGRGSEVSTLMPMIHQLHIRLLAGRQGQAVEIGAGIALLFLSITGLILWWPGKIFRVRWTARGRRVVLDVHNALGAYSWIFLMTFSLTAIVIHWNGPAERMFGSLTGSGPGRPMPRPRVDCPRPSVGADSILSVARRAEVGARVTTISMPDAENSLSRVNMKYPGDGTPAGRTIVVVNGCTGAVAYRQSTRSAPLGYKIARVWNREIHTGDIFGWPTRVLACIFSLSLPLMALTGPLIWWSRRRRPSTGAATSDPLAEERRTLQPTG